MPFWLHEPFRRSTPVPTPVTESHVVGGVDWVEPALIGMPLAQRRRAFRARPAILAVAASLLINAVMLALLAGPPRTPRRAPEELADTAALYASLVPASSIARLASAEPPTPQAPATVSDSLEAAPQILTPAATAIAPSETKASPSLQSAQDEEALLNSSPRLSADIVAVHKDFDNPWLHASIHLPTQSTQQRLWAAIRPCVDPASRSLPPIRLVFGQDGQVARMLNTQGSDATTDPALSDLVRAVGACGPYDHLVQPSASYLVVATS